ncbi:hypothetical protein [Pseudomonas asplenii]|uniref:hypothetical protein n=1 Tax=Pseudomonas asplenii TaxID=53407 RepID=UPI002362418D|nr:hypothetical protein [Pseudomonas asplenii]
MSKSKRSKNHSPLQQVQEPKAPQAPDTLPDIPGGEENLLPISALTRPLTIIVPMWGNSVPTPQTPESVRLRWDSSEFGFRQWTAPVPETDLVFEAPVEGFGEGQHEVMYELTLANGEKFDSQKLTLTIDKTKPLLNQTDEKPIFPDEIRLNGVTAAYLARPENNDEVKAIIPPYDGLAGGPRPGDVITWYLNERTGTGEPDQLRVDQLTVPDPVPAVLEAVYPGRAFRDFGDREGYARYRVEDRAGNRSELSARVDLDIKAAPIPRDLSYPRVKEATGSPQASQLNPNPADVVLNGAIVIIPQNALISEDETAAVLFGEPGSFGFYQADTPTTVGGREYRIPREYIARNLKKTIPVSFAVSVPSRPDPLPSAVHQLSISSLTDLPMIQCDKVTNDRLPLSSIVDGGVATFTLGSWKYMSTSQFLRVRVIGLLASGGQETITVLEAASVPASGTVPAGTISKATLQRFKMGEMLEIRPYVSFDNKATWYDFPYPTPTLTA